MHHPLPAQDLPLADPEFLDHRPVSALFYPHGDPNPVQFRAVGTHVHSACDRPAECGKVLTGGRAVGSGDRYGPEQSLDCGRDVQGGVLAVYGDRGSAECELSGTRDCGRYHQQSVAQDLNTAHQFIHRGTRPVLACQPTFFNPLGKLSGTEQTTLELRHILDKDKDLDKK